MHEKRGSSNKTDEREESWGLSVRDEAPRQIDKELDGCGSVAK